MKNKCENCGKKRKNFPIIYKGERWCSDQCRKAILGDDPTLTELVRRPSRKVTNY